MPLEFRKVLALRGPNIWANSPVLEAWVDLHELKDTASNQVPGFVDRLMAWLPTLIEHECSEGHRGGFLVRLNEGTYPAHVLEHVSLELQSLAGTPVGYGRARETSEPGVYKVVIKYREEALARACLESARELIMACYEDRPFDAPGEIRRLRELSREVCLGPTAAVVAAAKERGIPARRLDKDSLVVFGYGTAQRRLMASVTDRTSAIASFISTDKELTKSLLRSIGVPVPEGRLVSDAADAWRAAQEVGLPVVVKPKNADYGNGVGLNLRNREEVINAYAAAREFREEVLVESFVLGNEYRLLVVNGQVVAATRRDPPQVRGDGRSTVAQLVESANKDPRRGPDYAAGTPLRMIQLDEPALAVMAEQGHTVESVPAEGERVLIRRTAHYWLGGTTADVTDDVHPDVARRAEEAAEIVGLDIAGIDVVAQDIGRSLESQGGVIVEINAEPSLRMHLEPTYGQSRPVGPRIVDAMFAPGESGRIPIVAVTGVNGKTTTTRLIAHILARHGHHVGMTCTDGIYIASKRIEVGDCSGPRSARAILAHPKVDAAVLECARGGIVREGLGFDKCAVAVVTNIRDGDHLGLADIHTLEKLAQVKRVPIDVVLPEGTGVLNAEDPLVAAMAAKCPGSVTFFARDGLHPVVVEHRQAGGKAVFDRDGTIVLAEGSRELALMSLADVPLTNGGKIGFQVENALAGVAAAWGLGIPNDTIRAAVADFASDLELVPGRFNQLTIAGATVLVDFAHNPSAIEALAKSLDEFPAERRTAVFSTDGDRPDDSLIRQAQILANAIDRMIIYENDTRRRGRQPGEMLRLIREGIALGQRVSAVEESPDELDAIDHGLKSARPGELLLILHDNVEASLAFLRRQMDSTASCKDANASLTGIGQRLEINESTPA